MLTDVHDIPQIAPVAEVVDVLQTPAFLARQTDFIHAVAASGKPVNIKKAQFMAPHDMKNVVDKARNAAQAAGVNEETIMVCERGVSFGYNNLVSDMRSLAIMRETGCPVVFDATHSVQLPGGQGTSSGGQREFVPVLARAAVATGVSGLFMETHPDPANAKSDGPNAWPLDRMESLLATLVELDRVVKAKAFEEVAALDRFWSANPAMLAAELPHHGSDGSKISDHEGDRSAIDPEAPAQRRDGQEIEHRAEEPRLERAVRPVERVEHRWERKAEDAEERHHHENEERVISAEECLSEKKETIALPPSEQDEDRDEGEAARERGAAKHQLPRLLAASGPCARPRDRRPCQEVGGLAGAVGQGSRRPGTALRRQGPAGRRPPAARSGPRQPARLRSGLRELQSATRPAGSSGLSVGRMPSRARAAEARASR